jgi:hypothetical protein
LIIIYEKLFLFCCRYFSLDENHKSVGGNFAGVKGKEDKEEEWGVKDYI